MSTQAPRTVRKVDGAAPAEAVRRRAKAAESAVPAGSATAKPVPAPRRAPAKAPVKAAEAPVTAPRRPRPASSPRPVVAPRPAPARAPGGTAPAGTARRPVGRRRPGRAPFVLLVVVLLGGGLMSLLLLNVVLTQDSFRLTQLTTSTAQVQQQTRKALEDIARARSANRLAESARRQGMRDGGDRPEFLDAGSGAVLPKSGRP
ncbi:hypothetical protein [Rhizohabitans arisaemae]|uniref:hypothetical protein n=1 Tax=Rhizohabitans arisaemae TaxID=2720610 RepID=UPI0024B06C81|nr:hypothetical protein [Rhizohabitans arisaemae]